MMKRLLEWLARAGCFASFVVLGVALLGVTAFAVLVLVVVGAISAGKVVAQYRRGVRKIPLVAPLYWFAMYGVLIVALLAGGPVWIEYAACAAGFAGLAVRDLRET